MVILVRLPHGQLGTKIGRHYSQTLRVEFLDNETEEVFVHFLAIIIQIGSDL